MWAGLVATVTHAATVHVMNRYFSFWLKTLFLPGFHGNQPESTKQWRVTCPRHWRQISDELKIFDSPPRVH
jgi:hypothetical protein